MALQISKMAAVKIYYESKSKWIVPAPSIFIDKLIECIISKLVAACAVHIISSYSYIWVF